MSTRTSVGVPSPDRRPTEIVSSFPCGPVRGPTTIPDLSLGRGSRGVLVLAPRHGSREVVVSRCVPRPQRTRGVGATPTSDVSLRPEGRDEEVPVGRLSCVGAVVGGSEPHPSGVVVEGCSPLSDRKVSGTRSTSGPPTPVRDDREYLRSKKGPCGVRNRSFPRDLRYFV